MQSEPLTLTRAFEHYHAPILQSIEASKISFYGYKAMLSAWERFGFPQLDVRELRQSHFLAFRANIMSRGLSATTFDAHSAKIKAVLASLVTDGLMERVPPTPRISKTEAPSRDRPTPAEVVRLMQAADAAEWPTRAGLRRLQTPPGQFWRSIYAATFLTALRRSDVWKLRWESVSREGVRLKPNKTRRYRKEIFCPDVNGALWLALQPMRLCHTVRVYPTSIKGDRIAEAQRAIAIAAQVPAQRATFQAIRCASLDWWTEADERAAPLLAGHAIQMHAITRRHYVSADRQQSRAEQILLEAAGRLSLPEGFVSSLSKEAI